MSRELQDWLEDMAKINYIKPEDIPNIDLYMDQVTTFLESGLAGTKRTPDDKIMTKTMINNYTKNKLLPPPEKKKYGKDHIFLLILIYYFKSFLSISDLQQILTPLSAYCFGQETTSKEDPDLAQVYETLFETAQTYYQQTRKDMEQLKEISKSSFPDVEGEKGEFLEKMTFITLLSHDIYLRKKIIESMIDEMKDR